MELSIVTVDEMCVLKDTLDLAKGRGVGRGGGIFVNWGMNLPLSRLLPI